MTDTQNKKWYVVKIVKGNKNDWIYMESEFKEQNWEIQIMKQVKGKPQIA